MDSVYYLGIPGSFSSIASEKYFGTEKNLVGKPTVPDVLKAIVDDSKSCGVIPIENSVSGSVVRNYDLLLKSDVSIVGEIYLRISQNLLAKDAITLDEVKTVYSHPEALYQCDEFLQTLNVSKVEANDTASAAQYIAEKGKRGEAAIAGIEAAKLYDLTVLKKGIETNKANYTRFVVISKNLQQDKKITKISVLFTLQHKPGTLYRALGELQKRRLNFTKIESRPMLGKPFEYMFYMDFECQKKEDAISAIEAIRNKTETLRILGMYKKGDIYEE